MKRSSDRTVELRFNMSETEKKNRSKAMSLTVMA